MGTNDLIGNEKVKNLLKQIIVKQNISQSYMFIGNESIGKKEFAKRFAKDILCIDQDYANRACGKCESCIKYNGNNHPDYELIDIDENTIKINDMRKLISSLLEKPVCSSKKVYVINDSHKMTPEAQNSLLKTLEEPPSYVVIILITNNENAFLNTIKSRCTKIYFEKLKPEEIKKIIKENYDIDISVSKISSSTGSISKIINLKDKEENYEKIYDFFENIQKKNELDFFAIKSFLSEDKENIFENLDYLTEIIYNKVESNNTNQDLKAKYINCINIIEEIKLKISKNSNLEMMLDYLAIKMWEEIND